MNYGLSNSSGRPSDGDSGQGFLSSAMERFYETSLKINDAIDLRFYRLGLFISRSPCAILVAVVCVLISFIVGLGSIKYTSDIYQLWIEKGSRLIKERAFLAKHYGDLDTR